MTETSAPLLTGNEPAEVILSAIERHLASLDRAWRPTLSAIARRANLPRWRVERLLSPSKRVPASQRTSADHDTLIAVAIAVGVMAPRKK